MSMADQDEATAAVVAGLKRLYHTKLKPLEQTYMFGWFHSPPLTDSEFESKPQVLMCGQYSTGKTSVSGSLRGGYEPMFMSLPSVQGEGLSGIAWECFSVSPLLRYVRARCTVSYL